MDNSGGVAVKLPEEKYIQLLPLTIYQFERYIWRKAPEWVDYRQFVDIKKRLSPHATSKKNAVSAFLTGVDFIEANRICEQLLSGRAPTSSEWDTANHTIFSKEGVLTAALQCLQEAGSRELVDTRYLRYLQRILDIGITRANELKTNELVSEYPYDGDTLFGKIFLKSSKRSQAIVTGTPPSATRNPLFGFRAVFTIE